MASYIWYCQRCEHEKVKEQDELCEYCREEIYDVGDDEPVDKRMQHGYSRRLAEGFDREY
jgi:hypothetical protein